jgi:hypothetical protein
MSDGLPSDWRERFDPSPLRAMEAARAAEQGRELYTDADAFVERLGAFDSPIEAFLAWAVACHDNNYSGGDVYIRNEGLPLDFEQAKADFSVFCLDCACLRLFGPRPLVAVYPQTTIAGLRVDLLVIAKDHYGHPEYDSRTIAFVIECDGHAFHERTKKQAARDKARDRLLATSRLHVLRFTGSEIFNGAPSCAEQVWKFIREHVR